MPKRRRRRLHTRGDEMLGALAGWIVGYIAAEGILRRYMHPLHWIAALAVAVAAYGGVWLWYYWRSVYREEQARQRRER